MSTQQTRPWPQDGQGDYGRYGGLIQGADFIIRSQAVWLEYAEGSAMRTIQGEMCARVLANHHTAVVAMLALADVLASYTSQKETKP